MYHKSDKMFSKACEYGIKATIYIAVKSQQNIKVNLNDISKEIDSPAAFTSKILQKLTKSKILISTKGSSGGFEIKNNKMAKIMLSQIVVAIDGDDIYKGCGLGFNNCNEKKPCPVHHKYKQIRDDLRQMLETTSLLDLSKDINCGITFLKR